MADFLAACLLDLEAALPVLAEDTDPVDVDVSDGIGHLLELLDSVEEHLPSAVLRAREGLRREWLG